MYRVQCDTPQLSSPEYKNDINVYNKRIWCKVYQGVLNVRTSAIHVKASPMHNCCKFLKGYLCREQVQCIRQMKSVPYTNVWFG